LLGAHVRALVPDNLKSGVKRAQRYEPGLNPRCQDFAEHYGSTASSPRPT